MGEREVYVGLRDRVGDMEGESSSNGVVVVVVENPFPTADGGSD